MSIEDRVDSLVRRDGHELLPWQREYLQALDRGERPVFVGARRAGRSFVQKYVKLVMGEPKRD